MIFNAPLHRATLFIAMVLLCMGFSTEAQTSLLTNDSILLSSNSEQFNARLSALIQETLDQNRSLKAASSRIVESNAKALQTASYPLPSVEVEAMDAPLSSFPNPFKEQMEMDYSLKQMIMFPGKLSAMKRAGLKKKEMIESEKVVLEFDLTRKVKEAFYDIYLIDRQIDINHTSQNVLAGIVEIAGKQYEVGMGRQADILRAQTELSTLKKRLVDLEQRRFSMAAMINSLRNKPASAPIDVVPEIGPLSVMVDTNQVMDKALVNRPEIKSMQADIAMRKEDMHAAKLSWYPDFMVKATYKNKLGSTAIDSMTLQKDPDAWGIMLEMTIPQAPWSWGKSSAAIRQAEASVASAEEDLAEMQNMVTAQVIDALSQVTSYREQLRLTTTMVLPQARQAFESAVSLYRTGGQEFTMVLDAQRMLLMAQDDYHMTVMKYLSAIAQLERATGTSYGFVNKGDLK